MERDITAQITSGQLGSLLNLRNTVLPAYIGDAYQSGSINTLAQQFADTVNGMLTLRQYYGWPARAGGNGAVYIRHHQFDQRGANTCGGSDDGRNTVGRHSAWTA